MIKFDDLKLQTLTFEMRYAPAYRIWDGSGSLWTDLSAKFGELDAQSVAPNQVTHNALDRFALTVSIDKAHLVDYKPDTDFDKNEYFAYFVEMVVAHLGITAFSRLGTRLTMGKEFASQEDAAKELVELGLLKLPAEKMFGVEPKLVIPRCGVEVRDLELGYNLQVSAPQSIISFTPGPDARGLQPQNSTRNQVLVDLDLFTRQTVLVESFRVQDHFTKWKRRLNRDLTSMLFGK